MFLIFSSLRFEPATLNWSNSCFTNEVIMPQLSLIVNESWDKMLSTITPLTLGEDFLLEQVGWLLRKTPSCCSRLDIWERPTLIIWEIIFNLHFHPFRGLSQFSAAASLSSASREVKGWAGLFFLRIQVVLSFLTKICNFQSFLKR